MSTVTMKKSAPTLSKDVQAALAKLPTVSAKMRYLNDQGLTRGDIARALGKSYQHVKNVLDRPLKSAG
jgi:DNA-directed RNA polymerase specialized sigma24 family protein